MNSKNKYFKYKGNYYTSKEYIALKNKEIITQSGGVPLLAYKNTMNKFSVDKDKREKKREQNKAKREKYNKDYEDMRDKSYNQYKTISSYVDESINDINMHCKSREKTCLKNPVEQVLGEISNGLSELGNIMYYIIDYFKFIQKFCSNKYRVYYIPLTYRYNLTFKNIPWLFTLRSPLFYRSTFSDMSSLNVINQIAYDKKNIINPYLKNSISLYHTIFKNFQESTDKYIWNEVFEKLFIPLALDAPASKMPSNLDTPPVGGDFPDSTEVPAVPAVPAVPDKKGSGSIKQNENLLIEINDVTDDDVKQYKRLTRESFNFLLLILQNIALINEKGYLKSTSDKYKKDPTDDDNVKNYKRLITIGNFLKTGVFNLKDNVNPNEIKDIFNIWNNVRTQLKQLIKKQASKYDKITLYEEKEGEEDEEEKEEEKEQLCKHLQEIIKDWNNDSYIKSIFKTIYDVEDEEKFDFKDINLDLDNSSDNENCDKPDESDLVFDFIRLNMISLNILSLKLSDFSDITMYDNIINQKLKIIDKIFITCYLINIRNIPVNDKPPDPDDEDGDPDPLKDLKEHWQTFNNLFIEAYNNDNKDNRIKILEDLKESNHLKLKIFHDAELNK
tara:strand:+ start:2462 stop:4306 length:1845 start_codon:yes stop_codon:yes gene_type:complete